MTRNLFCEQILIFGDQKKTEKNNKEEKLFFWLRESCPKKLVLLKSLSFSFSGWAKKWKGGTFQPSRREKIENFFFCENSSQNSKFFSKCKILSVQNYPNVWIPGRKRFRSAMSKTLTVFNSMKRLPTSWPDMDKTILRVIVHHKLQCWNVLTVMTSAELVPIAWLRSSLATQVPFSTSTDANGILIYQDYHPITIVWKEILSACPTNHEVVGSGKLTGAFLFSSTTSID